MIRVAFPIIGGRGWTGGYNYLLNLVRVCQTYAPGRIAPVIFFGADSTEEDRRPFRDIADVEVVVDKAFGEAGRSRRIAEALITGVDGGARRIFRDRGIEVVFEAAQFYGWRLGIPAIAWIPDFQHHRLPHLFTKAARLRRAVGFNAQILAGRRIMLSSEDARSDCVEVHPGARGRTTVVHFATPRTDPVSAAEARGCADRYGLPETFFFLPNQFWIHKNHQLVIDALAVLARRGTRITVAASGGQSDPRDPGHFGRLVARARALGVDDLFRPLGLIPYPDIALLMRASTALINPSLFEGWSTTVEEAKATGTPMLLSDLPVHREQTEGDVAVYFDPARPASLADAIERFLAEPSGKRDRAAAEAARRSVDAAKAFAREFCGLAEAAAGINLPETRRRGSGRVRPEG